MTGHSDCCGRCKSKTLNVYPVFHHFICAYAGPSYDFAEQNDGVICPKCKRLLELNGGDWEIIGMCTSCNNCAREVTCSQLDIG
jgi:hypothetical protein